MDTSQPAPDQCQAAMPACMHSGGKNIQSQVYFTCQLMMQLDCLDLGCEAASASYRTCWPLE